MSSTSPYGATIGTQGPPLNAQALVDMKAIGLTDLRRQVPWHMIETSKGVYDFSLWDDAVSKCNAAGIALCLTIKQPPAFWTGANGLPDPQGTALIAHAAASRYDGKSGNGHIDYLEIGNEDYDFGVGTDPAPLAASLVAAYPAIKSAQPNLPVVMGSILQRNSTHIRAFMDGVWKNAAGSFDIANFHFYTCIPGNGMFDPSDGSVSNVPSLAQFIDLMRQSHAVAGKPNFPTWCSEFGFATTPNFGRPPKCVTDEATQWKYLQYCYDQFRTSGFITKAHLFTLGYASTGPDGMSLVQSNGHQVQAYGALQSYIKQYPSWDGAPPTPTPVPVPPPPPASQVIHLTNFTGTVTITPAP